MSRLALPVRGVWLPGDAATRLRRRARAVPALAPVAALAGLVGAGFFITAGAASRQNPFVPAGWTGGFPGWMSGPLGHLGLGLNRTSFALLLLLMLGCYGMVLARAHLIDPRWAVGAIVAAHIVFLLGPPILSADVFGYLGFARIGALHGHNPYVFIPATTPDIIDPYVGWPDVTTPYGPLFTLLSYPLAWLGIAGGLWTLKVLAAAGSLGCVALIWRCVRALGRDPVPAALLFGLNPLLLVYGLGGAHNDLFITTAVVGGIAATILGAERAGAGGLVAATALKLSSGVVLPFMLVGARRRRSALVVAVITAAVIAVVALVAFGVHAVDFLDAVRSQQKQVAERSIPRQLAALLGFVGLPAGLRAGCGLALAGVLIYLLVRTARGADWVACAGWATFTLLLTTAWLLPWYIVWLLPLAAIAGRRSLTLASVALTALIVWNHAGPLLGA